MVSSLRRLKLVFGVFLWATPWRWCGRVKSAPCSVSRVNCDGRCYRGRRGWRWVCVPALSQGGFRGEARCFAGSTTGQRERTVTVEGRTCYRIKRSLRRRSFSSICVDGVPQPGAGIRRAFFCAFLALAGFSRWTGEEHDSLLPSNLDDCSRRLASYRS